MTELPKMIKKKYKDFDIKDMDSGVTAIADKTIHIQMLFNVSSAILQKCNINESTFIKNKKKELKVIDIKDIIEKNIQNYNQYSNINYNLRKYDDEFSDEDNYDKSSDESE